MSLRENRDKIVISKTIISKTVIDKVKTRIQDMLETRRQGSTRILRGKIIVEETKTQMSEGASHVEYAKKPHMEISLDAQSSKSTFRVNQEDQPAYPRKFASNA